MKKESAGKAFNLRISKEMWVFLKRLSIEQEESMNEIIIRCLEKLKKNKEKSVDG